MPSRRTMLKAGIGLAAGGSLLGAAAGSTTVKTYNSPSPNTEGMAFDGQHFYLGSFIHGDGWGDYRMYKTDAAFNHVDDWQLPGTPGVEHTGALGLSHDGKALWYVLTASDGDYFVKDDGTGTVLDKVTWQSVNDAVPFAINDGFQGLAFVEPGVAWLSWYNHPMLLKYDFDTGQALDIMLLETWLECFDFDGFIQGGPWLWANSQGPAELYLVNVRESEIVDSWDPPAPGNWDDPEGMVSDGSTLYYASGGTGENEIYEMKINLDTNGRPTLSI